jgi:hypothetical protein
MLAKIPGVARDSIRNEGTREINHGIKKIIVRAPDTRCIGGCVGPGTGLDVVEKRNILPLPGIQTHLSTTMPVETLRTRQL